MADELVNSPTLDRDRDGIGARDWCFLCSTSPNDRACDANTCG